MSQLMKEYDLKSNHSDLIKKQWDKEYKAYRKVYSWADKQIKEKGNKRYYFGNLPSIIRD